MSRRKLKVVDYDKDHINCEDLNEVRRFVAIMEEAHLKKRDENWSAQLLDETDEKKWAVELENYFIDVGANLESSTAASVDFVLNAAIDKIYEQNGGDDELNGEKLKKATDAILEAHRDSQNPLNRLDYASPQFAENARALCSLLGISCTHPDPKVLMKAACLFISENLNDEVVWVEKEEEIKTMDIKEFPLGMSTTKNGAVQFSARVLRLLNLQQLREIQRKINETLVEIQNLTIDMTKQANLSQIQYGR